MKQSFFRIKYENLSELWEKCCSFKTKLIRICNDDVVLNIYSPVLTLNKNMKQILMLRSSC